jgi:Divergent InlB B-repeat domain
LTWLADGDHDGLPDTEDPQPSVFDGSSCQDGSLRSLSVSVNGQGTVSSSDGAIDCPTKCAASYQGGSVSLSPHAAAGWQFVGWSGSCSGPGTCSVSMDQSRSVTASFRSPPSCSNTDVTTQEDTPASVTVSCSDPGDGSLTYALLSPAAHGTVSGTGPLFTYTQRQTSAVTLPRVRFHSQRTKSSSRVPSR